MKKQHITWTAAEWKQVADEVKILHTAVPNKPNTTERLDLFLHAQQVLPEERQRPLISAHVYQFAKNLNCYLPKNIASKFPTKPTKPGNWHARNIESAPSTTTESISNKDKRALLELFSVKDLVSELKRRTS